MKFVPKVITRSIGRQVLTTKKNSPHIFFAGGVVGVIGSTIMACRATLKLEELLDDIGEDVSQVNGLRDDTNNSKYTHDDYRKDMMFVYLKGAGKVVRLYGPSAVVGVASLSALTGSHVQLTRRNSALTVTLAALAKAYDEYRIRVREVVGEDLEENIYYNVSSVDQRTVDGKKVVVKVANPDGHSIYARFFDEFSTEWKKDAEHNRIFLDCQQRYANHLLQSRGHVFLNEVYDALGLERSQAGQVVGWVRNGSGDNYIDFGMFDEDGRRFINGLERSILLDFNVDGVVYNLI